MKKKNIKLRPDRNLAMELVRVTEAAAISAAHFMGTGDKEGGDGAAVDAMRAFLKTVDMKGMVVIGEGEKNDAPMLYNGEKVGTGKGPEVDVAVDPVEGTNLLALGRPNSIAVLGTDNAFFAATGITAGSFLHGVRFDQEGGVTTESIVIRSLTGSVRYVKGVHQLNKKTIYA